MDRQTKTQKRAEQNLLKTALGPRGTRDIPLSREDRSAFSISLSKKEKHLLERKQALKEGIRKELGKNKKSR